MQSESVESVNAPGKVSFAADQPQSSSYASVSRPIRRLHSNLKVGYGSLRKDSIEGKVFELDTYAIILKKQALYYFAIVIICCTLWPILWVGIPVLAYRTTTSKLQRMTLIFLVVSVITGILFWTVPTIFVIVGGKEHVMMLLRRNEISVLDFFTCFSDQVLLLLAVVFSWIFHELTLDLSSIKETMMAQMKGIEWGRAVILEEEQQDRIFAASETALEKSSSAVVQLASKRERRETVSPRAPHREGAEGQQPFGPRQTTHEIFKEHGHEPIPLYQVMCILEEFVPGWHSGADEVKDYVEEVTGESAMFKDMLENASERATSEGLTSLDVFLTREQWHITEKLTAMNGIIIIWKQAKDWISLSRNETHQSPVWIAMAVILSLLRTIVPRLWLRFGLDGHLIPQDVGAMCVVISGSCITFCTSFYWLMIFMTVMLEYRRNIAQVMILGAMVEPRLRVRYVEEYLLSGLQFAYSTEQAEEVLGILPILSLGHATNVAAFWQLRDYVVLDRCNERMAMSVFLEMLIIWLSIKFVLTVILTVSLNKMTPFLIVTLFDVIIFGALLIYSLWLALNINDLTESHRRILVETRQRLVLAVAEADFSAKTKDISPQMCNLRNTRRLLAECEEIIKECDHRDRILLNMDVTPGKVVSVAASLCGAVFALFEQMLIQEVHTGKPRAFEAKLLQLASMHHLFGHDVSFLSFIRFLFHSSNITSNAVPMQLQNWGHVH